MKKIIISLKLTILIFFCALNLNCCAEEFFLEDDFNMSNIQNVENQGFEQLEQKIQQNYDNLQKRLDEAQKNKQNAQNPDTSNSNTQNQTQQSQTSIAPKTAISTPPKEKKGILTNLVNKFKKNKKEEEKRGYYGSLPDISKEFKYEKKSNPVERNQDYKVPTLEELNNEIQDEKLKKAPFDDALFLDNVLKKQDTKSEYLKDIQKTKFALLNLKKCIEENGSIQRFNACVNMIDLQSANLEEKYKNTSDSTKESYKDILKVNHYSKVLGNLLYDSNYYAQYIPTQVGKYSVDNIKNEKQKLLIKLNRTIFLINQES